MYSTNSSFGWTVLWLQHFLHWILGPMYSQWTLTAQQNLYVRLSNYSYSEKCFIVIAKKMKQMLGLKCLGYGFPLNTGLEIDSLRSPFLCTFLKVSPCLWLDILVAKRWHLAKCRPTSLTDSQLSEIAASTESGKWICSVAVTTTWNHSTNVRRCWWQPVNDAVVIVIVPMRGRNGRLSAGWRPGWVADWNALRWTHRPIQLHIRRWWWWWRRRNVGCGWRSSSSCRQLVFCSVATVTADRQQANVGLIDNL